MTTSAERPPLPEGPSKEVRLFRRTFAKFVAFTLFCGTGFAMVIGTLQGETGGDTDTYHALFGDVSGLIAGDPVRVAGVTVGKVKSTELIDPHQIKVTFTANHNQQISDATHAQVRYANLLGQRYLALTEVGEAKTSLEPDDTIPEERTAPAVSLTALLNGFRPVFQSLDADQVSELATDIVDILQGQTARIDNVIAQTAELTSTLADRSGLIVDVIDNLGTLVSTMAAHDDQFARALIQLRDLTHYLAADSESIGASIESVSQLARSVDGLVRGVRSNGLPGAVRDFNVVSTTLMDNADLLHRTFQAFPQTFSALNRVTQSGTFANGYPCDASVRTIGDPRVSIGDISQSLGLFLDLPVDALLSPLFTLFGGTDPGISVPVEVPQGPIGQDVHTGACR